MDRLLQEYPAGQSDISKVAPEAKLATISRSSNEKFMIEWCHVVNLDTVSYTTAFIQIPSSVFFFIAKQLKMILSGR